MIMLTKEVVGLVLTFWLEVEMATKTLKLSSGFILCLETRLLLLLLSSSLFFSWLRVYKMRRNTGGL
jgi:hypothetical protein